MKNIWNIVILFIILYPVMPVPGDNANLDAFNQFILRAGKRFMDAKRICVTHAGSYKPIAVNSSNQRCNFSTSAHEYVLKTSKVMVPNGKRHAFCRSPLSLSVSVATNLDDVVATGVVTEFNNDEMANAAVYGMEVTRSSMPINALVRLYDVTTVGDVTIFNYKYSKDTPVPEWQNQWISLIYHNISIRITFKSEEYRKDYREIALEVLGAIFPSADIGEPNSI